MERHLIAQHILSAGGRLHKHIAVTLNSAQCKVVSADIDSGYGDSNSAHETSSGNCSNGQERNKQYRTAETDITLTPGL